MGRWTPMILMAGGMAVLMGTLLGINFPMAQQNAQAPTPTGRSEVLPANINVNSAANGTPTNNGNSTQGDNSDNTTSNPDDSSDTNTNTKSNSGNQGKQPIPALW